MFKRSLFIFIISIFALSTLIGAEMETRMRIAILPFSTRGNIDKNLSELLSENFTIAMISGGKYNVVERSQLDKALSELKFQKGAQFDDASAVEIGKLAGAQAVIIGTISEIDGSYFVSARGIDVKTGIAQFATKEQTSNKRELINLIDKLASSISLKDSDKVAGNRKSSRREKDSSLSIATGNFTRDQKKFIDSQYDKWELDPADYEYSLEKYKQSLGAGIGVSVGGGTLTLMGIIFIGVGFGIREYQPAQYQSEYDEWGNYIGQSERSSDYYYRPLWVMGVAGAPILALGLIMLPLSAIPFWFSYMIKQIYRRATGEKLAFWDRVNFGMGFAMVENALTKRQENKFNLSISINL